MAIAVRNWDELRQFKELLLDTKRFYPDPDKPHRLRYKVPGGSFDYPLDLVPFGAIRNAANEVILPPGGRATWNVTGYEEALRAASDIRLSPVVVMRTISIPSFVVLKIFAWKDRGFLGQSKDATDISFALVHYAKAGNEARLWAEGIDTLEAVGHDIDIAGAHLLGTDVRREYAGVTQAALLQILSDDRERQILLNDMARTRVVAFLDLGELERRLTLFTEGLRGLPATRTA